MFDLKYYASIEAAQRQSGLERPDAIPPFDLDRLGADSWRRRLFTWLTGWLFPVTLALFRAIWPNPKFGRLVVVTRAADVRDVLRRPDDFEVPYGREMTELAGGENFVLGMEGPGHDEQNRQIRAAMPASDAERIVDLSRRFADALIRTSGGRIDVMKDFITRIATETCASYFGLQPEDPDAFAEWAMSISALLFADPFGDAATRQLALNGAARVRAVIDHSIANAAMAPPDSVLRRLIDLKATDPNLTDDKIRAILVGLTTGFVPTNTLAAGKILQELLRRPDLLRAAIARARSAAIIDRAGQADNADKAALQAILLEAARVNPALAPGQWRYARRDAVIASGTWRERKVPQGSVLMVATMSALRDHSGGDKPTTDLMFGDGIHACLGKYLAIAQITEIFMVLLSQANLRVAEDSWGSRIRWVGPFPRRLDMTFDPAVSPATQSMITVCAPLIAGADPVETAKQVQARIAALKNPANARMREMFDSTGIVHFASLALIEAGDAAEPAPHLLLELNVDGSPEAAFRSIADADIAYTQGELHAIFRNTPNGARGLAEILGSHVLDLKTRPWGAIGLNFNGTPEFSVPDIKMQDDLAKFARQALNFYMGFHANIGNRAMQALTFVRMFLQNSPAYAAALESPEYNHPDLREMVAAAPRLQDFLIVPSRRQLKISNWKPGSRDEAVFKFLQSRDYWHFAVPVIALAVLLGAAIFFATSGAGMPLGLLGRIVLAVIGGPAAVAALLALVVVLFLALLRYHETHDVPDDQNPDLAHVREIAGVENPQGFAQNHFMAVTELKHGWFRKLTLAMSLWGIKQMVLFLFRPGFVLNMGTIHYAKWFRIPGRDKLIFQANYDGSWESYLEDFIMKAHPGQTAAWCNGIGFPKTTYLVNDGARDGDRFKRWVRRQQVLAPFWYSRFPHLTTDQIRNNALIHDGLARASTDLAARAWLDCFGSIPRPDYAIESDEVQSLVFRGLRAMPCATYALIRLPDGKDARLKWLEKLQYGSDSPHDGRLAERDEACEISFGDTPLDAGSRRNLATFVAFSAVGLRKLGLADPTRRDGLGTFPNTFNLGMANRGRSLGDFGPAASTQWRWADTADLSPGDDDRRPAAVDAVLLIYGDSAATCDQVLEKHVELLGRDALVQVIPTAPPSERLAYDENGGAVIRANDNGHAGPGAAAQQAGAASKTDRVDYEHFGFHDGISQPVIRGTQRFSKGARRRDIVEPGEFILGYRNNQGYYPPTATVRAESDSKRHLPIVLADIPSRFPSFEGGNAAARDFGRNGSFLVIRQLAQDVEGFRDFVEDKARQLRDDYQGLPEAVGAPITAQWIAAKMMGRWPDGTPLIDRPGAGRQEYRRGNEQHDNDFTFGADDPQGLRCPFGAHIRRANPRDSMQPDDPAQLSITNRHRILRRGRTYEYRPEQGGKVEKGLVFACLCADLDRQYEFVQQTWIQSPSFHGLRDEPDPMIAWSDPDSNEPRTFTIPTPVGPVRLRDMKNFVTVRAGGYFFLPSRSAIRHLVDINRR